MASNATGSATAPIKDPQDIVYIFFSLAVGLAAGAGFHKIAIVGTVAIGATLLAFSRTRITTPRKEDYLLQFRFSPNGDESPDPGQAGIIG